MKIRVGSRDSRLAVIQSEMVMDCIRRHHPEIELELITMKTTGDRILDRTLDQIGGKGLFVKELDRALLSEQVDITVHSLKDMPMEQDPRLPVVAVSAREIPFDALVLPAGQGALDPAKPIGCASARRRIQLETLFPGHEIRPVRGNVQTRLAKLDAGEYSALILAFAGLKRLGLEERVSRVFTQQEMIPAACQGILAVQARAGMDVSWLHEFHDETAFLVSSAERSFVTELNGGCSAPIAAFAAVEGGRLTLEGLYQEEGSTRVLRDRISGPCAEAVALGHCLARRMREEAVRG